jgi:hypothetical protein
MNKRKLSVLVACEFSGIVRDAFIASGHRAWSCDLLPTEAPGPHIQGNVLSVLDGGWDLMVGHPPCTHLASIGASSFKDKQADGSMLRALKFFIALWNAPIPCIALENPVGLVSTLFAKPTQIIQPYWFGDTERKATCLWLKNLPCLEPTHVVEPKLRVLNSQERGTRTYPNWHEASRSGKDRSRTFPGVAAAMAACWGAHVEARVKKLLHSGDSDQ